MIEKFFSIINYVFIFPTLSEIRIFLNNFYYSEKCILYLFLSGDVFIFLGLGIHVDFLSFVLLYTVLLFPL